MENLLSFIDTEYSGRAAYFHNQIEITNADIEQLKATYLE